MLLLLLLVHTSHLDMTTSYFLSLRIILVLSILLLILSLYHYTLEERERERSLSLCQQQQQQGKTTLSSTPPSPRTHAPTHAISNHHTHDHGPRSIRTFVESLRGTTNTHRKDNEPPNSDNEHDNLGTSRGPLPPARPRGQLLLCGDTTTQ